MAKYEMIAKSRKENKAFYRNVYSGMISLCYIDSGIGISTILEDEFYSKFSNGEYGKTYQLVK